MIKSAKNTKARLNADGTPYIPFLKDRVHLSQDAIEARANREPILNVHKRNPHTTYLSEIELFIDMINTVSAAQQTARAQEAPAPVAAAIAPAKAGIKPKPKLPVRPPMKQAALRKPAMPAARMLSSGVVISK